MLAPDCVITYNDPSLTRGDLQDFLEGYGQLGAAVSPGIKLSKNVEFQTIHVALNVGFQAAIMQVSGCARYTLARDKFVVWRSIIRRFIYLHDIADDPYAWMLIDIDENTTACSLYKVLRRPENLETTLAIMRGDHDRELPCFAYVVGTMDMDETRRLKREGLQPSLIED